MSEAREHLKDKKRIVIKVGTSTLSFPNGKMNFTRVERLCMVLADLMNCGHEVVLVTSGAIGVGAGRLKMDAPPTALVPRQALAALGQVELIRIYQGFFEHFNQMIAQVLLTPEGLDEEFRRKNAGNTLNELLSMRIVPVINENDTVSTVEIQFGDNDTLAAKVAGLINADLLMILSDIDGLYTSDPNINENAEIIHELSEITEEIESIAMGSSTSFGKGGMATKIAAMKICQEAGTDVVIINGDDHVNIHKVLDGKVIGTLFTAKNN